MQWLSKITGNTGTTMTITIAGKQLSVYCSHRADKELAHRQAPLCVEIELAFACIARKAVHFHETPLSSEAITLNEHLVLQLTTRIPDNREADTSHTASAQPGLRNFLPKWVRLDYGKGGWRGEYGF